MQYQEVKKLREQGLTFEKIAQKARRTSERIRQIYNAGERQECTIHQTSYTDKCLQCEIEYQYIPYIKSMNFEGIFLECETLSVDDNSMFMSLKRKALVRYMRDELGFTYVFIARLLNRDHTTIMHLYANS